METELLSASVLAYVGDAVFTLFVRECLAKRYDYKSGELTKIASRVVSAKNQAQLLLGLGDFLTLDEVDIVKRCRNSHGSGFAKNASISEYRRATGLEGLLGYLYLKKSERLAIILDKCIKLSDLGEKQ